MEGFLVLENGDYFEGNWVGQQPLHPIEGEVVFVTSMTGYQEVVTDPSFKGQIVVFTYPLIGNCGVNEVDLESNKPQVSAVIICEYSFESHHYEAVSTFAAYLDKWQVPTLTNVDTRAIVKRIRNQGVMGGFLVSKVEDANFENYQVIEEKLLIKEVSTDKIEMYGIGTFNVVLMDFGYKKSIITTLNQLGCRVTVVPYNTTFETIQSLQPDGILLSNGPGDPKQMSFHLPVIKKLLQTYPTLAIGLGHQIVALAFGANTKKLKYGHYGANQPVSDLLTKKVFMSSQNHSFVVVEKSLQGTDLSPRYLNVNDRSIEGVIHNRLPIISVQFHPEVQPDAVGSSWLFADFVGLMNNVRREKVYA
ncbi:carbamoyl phosphate synthase small subunit [Calidifontibacillus oryziterrae]|uniref:carbamoyl phosphate synthase small subunit n=1 Tax=Calidifontibacillus oryziterrae TaxID=1191699 RepID=UPI0002E9BE41|nr:carbamoyl phosphate synthase small subunit [Calidifontibacillus oryziterrae]